nr:sulfotransferase domain-containing protein [Falsirhodobacter deserti]
MFDRSAETVCRSEVNEISGTCFSKIGGTLFEEDLSSPDRTNLMRALQGCMSRRSLRDRFDMTRKDFFRGATSAGLWMMSKRRVRQALSATGMMNDPLEWEIPDAMLNRRKLDLAVPVLKLNSSPAWGLAYHDMSPAARIVLNIREPVGYINSWYNRFVPNADKAHFRNRFPSACRILEHFGQSGRIDRLSRLTDADLIEIELWRWRYTNEVTYERLKGSDRFMTVTYAEVDNDAVAVARKLYEFAGLQSDQVAMGQIAAMQNTLFADRRPSRIDRRILDRLLPDVLGDSLLAGVVGMNLGLPSFS